MQISFLNTLKMLFFHGNHVLNLSLHFLDRPRGRKGTFTCAWKCFAAEIGHMYWLREVTVQNMEFLEG